MAPDIQESPFVKELASSGKVFSLSSGGAQCNHLYRAAPLFFFFWKILKIENLFSVLYKKTSSIETFSNFFP